MFFFRRSGKVNRDICPNRDGREAASLPTSPSSSFLAASSTLNEISFDVPTVCRLMWAARPSLSFRLPMNRLRGNRRPSGVRPVVCGR